MKPDTRSFYRLAVQRAVEHVLSSLDEALDLERLARGAALSPFHFHRIFRGMLGETPLELQRRLRMERAASRLLLPHDSVTTLAFEAGYETHEAFTRAFRALYGCSPSEFRQRGSAAVASCARPPQIEIAARSGLHFQPDAPKTLSIELKLGESSMNVEIKHQSAFRTGAVEHRGSYFRIAEAFERLGNIAGAAGLLREKPIMLAIFHDDPETTPEPELRSEAAISIPEGAALPAGLHERRVPAGRYAMTTHVGPYEQLPDAWARFMGEWLPNSGERLGDGVSYEVYVNTPMDVPKERLTTELYLPLL